MEVHILLGFDIIARMGQERFKKTIFPGQVNGGIVIKTEGGKDRVIDNPAKEKYISPELLGNLRSLAIEAFVGEADDSSGQAYLNTELDKLKKKYPEEQPQEVWRRTISTFVGQGVGAEDIAGALLTLNNRFYVAISLGEMSQAQKNAYLDTLKGKITEYWPSSPNSAA